MALTKIYKSRDGLAAVSSNTSIMSELSNISKSSLPSSMPTTTMAAASTTQPNQTRHGSISSTMTTASSSTNKPSQQQQHQFQVPTVPPPPPPTAVRHNSLTMHLLSTTLSAQKSNTQSSQIPALPSTPSTNSRIQSTSAKLVILVYYNNINVETQFQKQKINRA